MNGNPYDVIVAGHICLDMIPEIAARQGGLLDMLAPGQLVNIGPAVVTTGGSVPNTGLALHRLGIPTRLMGKVGKDAFGQTILNVLRTYGEEMSQSMIVSNGVCSSYTIVINPPGLDRMFLHCTGANDTFAADDLKLELVRQAKLFHFGYPPLMKSMYTNEGQELIEMFTRVKSIGLTTSLDMARPDPQSAAGKADWRTILRGVLPFVDIFMPSLEEILFMLDRHTYENLEKISGSGEILRHVDGQLLSRLADQLLDMGVAIAAIKLGEYGLYVRTAAESNRLSSIGHCSPQKPWEWASREYLVPSFKVEVAGTTGAGDCTIAGFLAGLLQGLSLEEAIISAAAVGACNVECSDAVSGIPAWLDVLQRINGGWEQRESRLSLPGWTWNSQLCMYEGSHHQGGEQAG